MEPHIQGRQSGPLKSLHLLLQPAYLGSIDRYAAIEGAGSYSIDYHSKFNKRFKEAHRTTIHDANGPIQLTIPIVKPQSRTLARWDDIVISDHDCWWHNHLEALKSAYGRTPFFEFYLDDIQPFYTQECAGMKLWEYLSRYEDVLRRLLQLEINKDAQTVRPYNIFLNEIEMPVVEYYQQRNATYGFMPGLSIADLLFNMGPESILVLNAMSARVTISTKPATNL